MAGPPDEVPLPPGAMSPDDPPPEVPEVPAPSGLAARLGDMHACPETIEASPPIPHVGGPIFTPGAPTVLIGGMPAATVGCVCMCVGEPDSITQGSATVLIGGRPAARVGDGTLHGGTIVVGCPTVMIGD